MPYLINPAVEGFYKNSNESPKVDSAESLKELVNVLSSGLKLPIEHDGSAVKLKTFNIPTYDGSEINAFWYAHPEKEVNGPAVLYFHGGGYLGSKSAFYDDAFRYYVLESKVSLLSVDYRLTPEFAYPVPQEDGYAALHWIHKNSDSLGIDSSRIAVMGDSAGGGLAASVAVMARSRGLPLLLKAQFLIYPMLDYTEVNANSSTLNSELCSLAVWSNEFNRIAWRALVGERMDSGDIPEDAAPARLTDFTNLPPTYITCGLLDIFRDDNVNFALKLWENGQDCDLRIVNGVPHLFDFLGSAESPLIQNTWRERIEFLQTL